MRSGLHPADSLEIVEQLPLLRLKLRRPRQMLQGASAAHPEVRAARHDAVRRGDDDIDQTRLVQVATPLDHAQANALARQGALDEHGLAADARDAAAVVRQVDDIGLLNVADGQPAGHAAENSCKCAAGESFSSLRVRATSWACSAAFKCPRSSSKRK